MTSSASGRGWLLPRKFLAGAVALLGTLFAPGPGHAVPSYAEQTGQACASCHIGAFGPQLTPFGRAFKNGGYTLQGGTGPLADVPISAIALGSFNNTAKRVPADNVTPHYASNNNFTIDAVALYFAGRITDFSGAFVQGTYSGINRSFHLDLTDIRPFTTMVNLGGKDLRIGTTINNTPTVTDPYNSTFAWGYPYVASGLAPTPAAQPVLANGFAGNSLGLTAYAWYDNSLYLEAGGYQTYSPYLLARTGAFYGTGQSQGIAPYARAAYEWNWSGQSAHVGALYFRANTYPLITNRSSNRAFGADQFTDTGVDVGYQWLGDTHIVTFDGIYLHEHQALNGTTGISNDSNGTGFGSGFGLNQVRATTSYWYENTYGATVAWQKTFGAANPVLYGPLPVSGSRNAKPNSNAFIFELSYVPFGKTGSWGSPLANLRLGVSYTAYTQFNGASHNYDGFGRNASDNNTLFLYSFLSF